MLCQVLLDQVAERELRGPPVAAVEPLEHKLQCLQRVALTREPAHLGPSRATTVDAIAVRPQRLAIRASRLQLDYLSVLRDHRLLLSLDPQESRRVARNSSACAGPARSCR